MVKVDKISIVQLMSIIIVNRFLFVFSFMPTVSMAPANQDAWIVELLSGPFLYITIIPLVVLATNFRNKTFEQYTEIIMGKTVGKFLGLMYSFYLLFVVYLTIIFITDFFISAVIPDTPLYAIVIFMMIPCMYATFKGLESIGRTSIIFVLFITVTVIIYFIFNYNNMDFKVFLPILYDSTMPQFVYGVINNSTRFCDAFLFFTFIAYVNENKKYPVSKIVTMLIIIIVVINITITIATQAVLTPGLAKTFRYPYFISIQQINLFDIIQRIEFFNVIGWIMIFFIKISSTFLSISIFMAQVFNTKSYKPFIIPCNIIIFIIAISTKISHFITFRMLIYDVAYIIIFTMNTIIPSIILIVFLIRKKRLSSYTTNKKNTI